MEGIGKIFRITALYLRANKAKSSTSKRQNIAILRREDRPREGPTPAGCTRSPGMGKIGERRIKKAMDLLDNAQPRRDRELFRGKPGNQSNPSLRRAKARGNKASKASQRLRLLHGWPAQRRKLRQLQQLQQLHNPKSKQNCRSL